MPIYFQNIIKKNSIYKIDELVQQVQDVVIKRIALTASIYRVSENTYPIFKSAYVALLKEIAQRSYYIALNDKRRTILERDVKPAVESITCKSYLLMCSGKQAVQNTKQTPIQQIKSLQNLLPDVYYMPITTFTRLVRMIILDMRSINVKVAAKAVCLMRYFVENVMLAGFIKLALVMATSETKTLTYKYSQLIFPLHLDEYLSQKPKLPSRRMSPRRRRSRRR